MGKNKKNLWLLLIVVALAVLPVIFIKNAEFEGVDQHAVNTMTQTVPNFKPWSAFVLQPKSSEIESSLFALQAAVGAGVIGYCLGYLKGRKEDKNKNDCN